METTNTRWRGRLALLAGAALLALAALPNTRWLVRQQVRAVFPVAPDPASEHTRAVFDAAPTPLPQSDPTPEERAAARHPDEFRLQLAAALSPAWPYDSQPKRDGSERLRTLAGRFGDNPSLYANWLRFVTSGDFRMARPEGAAAVAERPERAGADRTPKPPGAERLAEFDAAAEAGERVDPSNAFFPMMRAMGLFAARRDDEALAALERAGGKPVWREYIDDEVYGRWRAAEIAHGEPGAIARTSVAAAILFPHYAGLREVGRMAVAKAVEAEQAGDVERGLAIRRALARCGATMRAQSQNLIGSLVGIAITRLAAMRPGGSEQITGGTAEQKTERRLAAYTAYLEQHGRDDEARWFRAENEAGERVRAIARRGTEHSVWGKALLRLSLWSLADLVTLNTALWVLAFGGAAALLARSRRIRAGLPLPAGAGVGVTLGLATCSLLVTVGLATDDVSGNSMAVFLGAAVCLLLATRLRRWSTSALRAALGGFAFTTLGLSAVGALAFAQASGLASPAAAFQTLNGFDAAAVEQATHLRALLAGAVLLVPAVMVWFLGEASRKVGVPVSVGIVRGLRGLALPVASVLLLVYGGCVLATLRQDAAAREGVERTLAHEGRYYADLLGTTWPGATPE